MTDRNFSFIKLDLDLLKTKSDFESFMEHHGIPKDDLDIDYFLEERQWTRMWILDPITYAGICWVDRSCPDDILWLPAFVEEVDLLPAYDPSKDIKNISLDSILDKISEVGIDGLTQAEKDFLDNHSNNI